MRTRHLLAVLGCTGLVAPVHAPAASMARGGVDFLPYETLRLGLATTQPRRRYAADMPLMADPWRPVQRPPGLAATFAWLPGRQFSLALDVQWTRLAPPAVSGSPARPPDTLDGWDYRLGAAWQFRPGWHLRGGFQHSRPHRAAPWLASPWPDEPAQSLDLGIGTGGKRWSIDAVYEYSWSRAVHDSDTGNGFFGDWQNGEHVGGITATFRY